MVKVYVKVDADSLITEVNSEIFMESIDAVSYTHLDVYKRQIIDQCRR